MYVAPRSQIVMKHDVQLDSRETNNFRWDLPVVEGNETEIGKVAVANSEWAIATNKYDNCGETRILREARKNLFSIQ